MRINNVLSWLYVFVAAFLSVGCSDDIAQEVSQGIVSIEEPSVVLPQKGRYYSIGVKAVAAPGTLSVTTDDD